MNRSARILSVLVLGAFVLTLTGFLQAQGMGTLKGKVIDKSEKLPLPTVKVSLSGTKRFAVTGPDGTFFIKDIPAGTYKVVFELSGYMTVTQKDVAIIDGGTAEVNIVMNMAFAHEVTVTARREVESLQQVPQNIEVLTSTKLQETPTLNVVQALNNVTGVDVETGSGGTTLGTFMSIDGYDDVYIRKMVDGVDVGEVVNNWSMLNSYPQEMIDQVEVIKGGSSSVWGSNMGGIINIITKRPKGLTRPVFNLRGNYSNFGTMNFAGADAFGNSGNLYNVSANLMGNLSKFGYMLGYGAYRNDGFVEYGREKNNNAFVKLTYDFSDRTQMDVFFNRNKMDTQNYAFLKLEDLLGPDFPYYWNYKADYLGTSYVGSMRFSTFLNPAVNVEAQLKFNRSDFNGTTTYLDGSLFQPPAGTVDRSHYIDQKMGFSLKGSYIPGETFSLVSGVDYYRVKADFSGFIADQPVIYVDEVAPFLNAEYRIGNLGLHAGARYDYDSSFGSQLSPSFGATYNFFKASLVRVNVARTFRVPPLWYTLGVSYFDQILPNPHLKPERAWAYSAGFETQELQWVYLKLSVYYHKMTDGIVTVPADTEGRFTWGNIADFTRKGYEAEVGFVVPIGLTAYAGANYNKHENVTNGSISSVTWIPTRTYKTGLLYKNDKFDFFANLRGRWIWWNMDPGTAMLLSPRDKKWIFDMRISKGFRVGSSDHIGLFVDIFNLTNQAYWDRIDMPNPRFWMQGGIEIGLK